MESSRGKNRFRPVRAPWSAEDSLLRLDKEVDAHVAEYAIFKLWLWKQSDGALGTLEDLRSVPERDVLFDVRRDRRAAVEIVERTYGTVSNGWVTEDHLVDSRRIGCTPQIDYMGSGADPRAVAFSDRGTGMGCCRLGPPHLAMYIN
jgi:hypothetical protein